MITHWNSISKPDFGLRRRPLIAVLKYKVSRKKAGREISIQKTTSVFMSQ
jgi:hypothetical protein